MNAPDRLFADRRRPWHMDEDAVLRECYSEEGAEAAALRLPGRSVSAIIQRASKLGVPSRYGREHPQRERRRWETSDQIDAAIRDLYAAAPGLGQVREAARRWGRPQWWVQKRAVQLGVVMPRYKEPPWSPAELAYLEAHAHLSVQVLRKKFAQHGWRRTASAIALRVKRAGFSSDDPDCWVAAQLARLMGVDRGTVTRWVKLEGLPATVGSSRTGSGPDALQVYRVSRRDLRRWIGTHAQLVDLRKVDRYWFIDLAFGGK